MSYTYDYPRPALTVDAIVFRKLNDYWQVLLIERGNEPFIGKWAFPGGFVDIDEEIETAASRELEEETGLANVNLQQYKAIGTLGRDPRHRTVSVIFWAEINSENSIVKAGDDAKNADWFPIDNLPDLAFDHNEIIQELIELRKLSI